MKDMDLYGAAEAVGQIAEGIRLVAGGYDRLVRQLTERVAEAERRVAELSAVAEERSAALEAARRDLEVAVARRDGFLRCVREFEGVLERTMLPEVRERVAGLEDPGERYVVAAGLTLKRVPVAVDPEVEDALYESVVERVDRHLERHPVLGPVRGALIARLFSRLRREFGAERVRTVPFERREEAFEFVRDFPLPEPATMRPLQVLLISARGRLGLTASATARIIGVTPGTYVRWEMGDSGPHRRYEAAVAAFLERAGLAGGRVVPLVGYERAADPGRLAELRRRAGLTQREAAARAGIPQYTLSRLERGRAVRGGRVLEARLLAFYRGLLGGGEAAEA